MGHWHLNLAYYVIVVARESGSQVEVRLPVFYLKAQNSLWGQTPGCSVLLDHLWSRLAASMWGGCAGRVQGSLTAGDSLSKVILNLLDLLGII